LPGPLHLQQAVSSLGLLQLVRVQIPEFPLGTPLLDVARDLEFQKEELQLGIAGLG
jgi:hypothetical protein